MSLFGSFASQCPHGYTMMDIDECDMCATHEVERQGAIKSVEAAFWGANPKTDEPESGRDAALFLTAVAHYISMKAHKPGEAKMIAGVISRQLALGAGKFKELPFYEPARHTDGEEAVLSPDHAASS